MKQAMLQGNRILYKEIPYKLSYRPNNTVKICYRIYNLDYQIVGVLVDPFASMNYDLIINTITINIPKIDFNIHSHENKYIL